MVRVVDSESRKRAVLAETIKRFIASAVPVSSESLAEKFGLSSATIRNIFAELEEAGLLTHPHTSGGRIPTSKGYRYYVDLLISEMPLLEEERERIQQQYLREAKRLEEALEKASELLAEVTHYAGFVSFLEWQDRVFYHGISEILSQPEFRNNIESIQLIIKLIEDKKKLLDIINRDIPKKVTVYIGNELETTGVENCALVVSSYCFNNKPVGRIAVLGPMRMQYTQTIPTVEFISDILSEVINDIA